MKYRLLLTMLILGCLFVGMLSGLCVSALFARCLGVRMNAPLNEQPNGCIWAALFMASFMILMVSGYAMSFVVLAYCLRRFCGWNKNQTRGLIYESRIPPHWLLTE